MNFLSRILLSIPALLWAGIGFAASFSLPTIFADGMVLQQQTEVRLWGKAAPDAQVRVSASFFRGHRTAVAASDSTWTLTIPTPAASFEEQTVKVSVGRESRIFHGVLIGEVWLASGQSNMQFRLANADGGLQAIANSTNPYLRFYSQQHVSSVTVQDDCLGVWEQAEPATSGDFSAVAYFAARQLFATLNVPVAVVHSSWAGSTVEAWVSPEGIAAVAPELHVPLTAEENKPLSRKPCALYRGMTHAIAGYTVRGIWWYQGESGRVNPELYRRVFPRLCREWRRDWHSQELPVYTVEIPPYEYPDTIHNCGYIREVQFDMTKHIHNVWLVPMLDMGDSLNLHPTKKREVGERLAYFTLNKTYGYRGIDTRVLAFREMTISGDTCKVTFNHAMGLLSMLRQPVTGFEVAGEDHVFHPATALITKTCLVVRSALVPHPVAVRYCFRDYAVPSLFGTNGLPAYPFRTDNW